MRVLANRTLLLTLEVIQKKPSHAVKFAIAIAKRSHNYIEPSKQPIADSGIQKVVHLSVPQFFWKASSLNVTLYQTHIDV